MDEGRYDMRALIQFPSHPKGEQRPPKAALKRVKNKKQEEIRIFQ